MANPLVKIQISNIEIRNKFEYRNLKRKAAQ